MYLFFDTETSGLPDYNLDLHDPKQPNILSMAMVLTDESGRAYEINKIGNDMLNRYGFGLYQHLMMFKELCEKSSLKIAHNYRFDGFLLKAAYQKVDLDPGPTLDRFCTMKAFKEVTGKGGLADAYLHCMGVPLDNAHDALSDARACKDVFFWLKNNGHFKPQPRVASSEAA